MTKKTQSVSQWAYSNTADDLDIAGVVRQGAATEPRGDYSLLENSSSGEMSRDLSHGA